MACNLLFQKNNPLMRLKVVNLLNSAIKNNDVDIFFTLFEKGQRLNTLLRTEANTFDNDEDICQSRLSLFSVINDTIDSSSLEQSDKIDWKNKIISKIFGEDFMYPTITDDINVLEAGRTIEMDRSVDNALDEIFNNQTILCEIAKRRFASDIYNIILFDDISGGLFSYNITDFNTKIQNYKKNLFNTLYKYIKENFPSESISNEYNINNIVRALSIIKKNVINKESYNSDIEKCQNNIFSDINRIKQSNAFSSIVEKLLNIESFETAAKKRFTKLEMRNMKLFSGESYSKYFNFVNDFISKNSELVGEDILREWGNLRTAQTSMLDVISAYATLLNFDYMLKYSLANEISIEKGTMGQFSTSKEKYALSKDTSHGQYTWSSTETNSVEKHTSNTLKSLLSTIPVRDFETDIATGEHLDITKVAHAFEQLRNELYGRRSNKAEENIQNRINNILLTIHDDPINKLHDLFSLLFDFSHTRTNDLWAKRIGVANNRLAINTLYSFYNFAFNLNNSDSLLSRFNRTENSDECINIIESLCEVLNLSDANYLISETSYITGKSQTTERPKYFSKGEQSNLNKRISSGINNLSQINRRNLSSKYEFSSNEGQDRYTVKLTDEFSITFDTSNSRFGMCGYLDEAIKIENDVLNDLKKIDLTEFKENYLLNKSLSNEEQELVSVLKFIDDTLGLNILSSSGIDTLQIMKERGVNYLNGLVKLAGRMCYINDMYVKALDANKSLEEYLKDEGDYLYNNKYIEVFSKKNCRLSYRAAEFRDEILQHFINAQATAEGKNMKSTNKNKSGDSVPNYTVPSIASNIDLWLDMAKETALSNLIFAKEPGLISRTYLDSEVTNMFGRTKNVKNLSAAELIYHAIFDKFYSVWSNDAKEIIIQPMTYADKTSFINYRIKLSSRDLESIFSDGYSYKNSRLGILSDSSTYSDRMLNCFTEYIGKFYKELHESVTDKLTQITNEYIRLNNIKGTEDLSLNKKMQLMTEEDFVSTANVLGLDVTLDTDYKVITTRGGGKRVAFNSLLEYNTRLFNDNEALKDFMNSQAIGFVKVLKNSNCLFQVLQNGMTLDQVKNYFDNPDSLKEGKGNVILDTIYKIYSNYSIENRNRFLDDWVSKDGKLILAKQNGKNITSRSSINENEEILLNPILEKYFYIDSFFSQNLSLATVGSEIAHSYGNNVLLTNLLNANLETVNALQLGVRLTNSEFNILKQSISSVNCEMDLMEIKTGNENVDKALKTLTERICRQNRIKAQTTQVKRNMVMPATYHEVFTNTRYGVADEVQCAIVRDIDANVHNYEGKSDKIKPHDGAAFITPFQMIMENNSLGNNAMDLSRKPIWHENKEGSAFLGKMAAYVLTNEMMRNNLGTEISPINLFRKATDLQWGSDVTLRPSRKGKMNLLTNPLYYKTLDGEVVAINEFFSCVDKETGIRLYATTEYINGENSTKYHVFASENKTHIIFDDFNEAIRTINENPMNYHTVNSLFELHQVLGGIYCTDSRGNFSEKNNEEIVKIISNTNNGKVIQNGLQQFSTTNQGKLIKTKYHIGYIFNLSAVKNGARNVNPSSKWSDGNSLTTTFIRSDGLGAVLNYDESIDENSTVTEATQAISAALAYGLESRQTNNLLSAIATNCINSSTDLADAVNGIINSTPGCENELYDVVGRIILRYSSRSDFEITGNMIMNDLKEFFYRNKNHNNDKIKIPFSDSAIYNRFINSLTTFINNESIRRRFPGSGCVQNPSFNMVQNYFIDGIPYNSDGVLKLAIEDYRNSLIETLSGVENAIEENGDYYITYTDLNGREQNATFSKYSSIEKLENLILNTRSDISNNKYWTRLDGYDKNLHLIREYLKSKSSSMPEILDATYFTVTDVVDIYKDGKLIQTRKLDSLQKLFEFYDDASMEENSSWTFRENITIPRNLRPSIIKWKYLDANGKETWMNYFALDHIREMSKKESITKEDRQKINNALYNLNNGRFTFGTVEYNVMEGSLSNTDSEVIMGYLFQEKFGINQGDHLSTILKEKENYFFHSLNTNNLIPPSDNTHDIMFLSENGRYTGITFSEENTFLENPFLYSELTENSNGEISTKNGIVIGRWAMINESDPDPIKYKNGRFYRDDSLSVDQMKYRIQDGNIYKRYDYIKRYTYFIKGKNQKNIPVTLYKISDEKVFSLSGNSVTPSDIISQIYTSGDYTLAQINFMKANEWNINEKKNISNVLSSLSDVVDIGARNLLNTQIEYLNAENSFDNDTSINKDNYYQAKEQYIESRRKEFFDQKNIFIRSLATKKFASFQDSLKLVSAHIPGQGLQSFTHQRVVGFVQSRKNNIYISHFQTYLDGSDFDIDKLYSMAQGYDSKGQYIGWSPLFNYNTLTLLEESKNLPMPRNITLTQSNNGVDITSEIDDMIRYGTIQNGLLTTDHTDEIMDRVAKKENISTVQLEVNNSHQENDIKFLRAVSSALYKLSTGEFSYHGINDITVAINTLQHHESFKVRFMDEATKNIIFHNLNQISKSLKNRNFQYNPTGADVIYQAAENTPKAKEMSVLDVLNPLTKYIVQNDAVAAKGIVGIMANGLKAFYNIYNHFSTKLQNGDTDYLSFKFKTSRIQGRANGKPSEYTVDMIPDLNMHDENIVNNLASIGTSNMEFVADLISSYISMATDDMKNPIVAKINSTKDFAGIYSYMAILGFNINDIVSFMTSPAVEMINNNINENMFEVLGTTSFRNAINKSKGIVTNRLSKSAVDDISIQLDDFLNSRKSPYKKELRKLIDKISLDDNTLRCNMQKTILALAATDSTQNISDIVNTEDNPEYSSYIDECDAVLSSLRSSLAGENKVEALRNYFADIEEFENIYQASSEMTNITTTLFSLNTGVPVDEVGILRRLANISRIVYSRESDLDITKDEYETNEDSIIEKISTNNSSLSEEYIRQTLTSAYDNDIIENFDSVKFLSDPDYRNVATAYLDIIKKTFNAFDIIYSSPMYNSFIEKFKDCVISRESLSYKAQLTDEILKRKPFATNNFIKGTIKYANAKLAYSFISRYAIPVESTNGFDITFKETKVNEFDLSRINDICGFRRYVETDFLFYLKENYADNPLVKHLCTSVMNDGKIFLTVDFSMINPTTNDQISYTEACKGKMMLDKESFNNSEFSIADILALYTIMVNQTENMIGSLKDIVLKGGNSIMTEYQNEVNRIDRDINSELDYNLRDCNIVAAPLISEYNLRFATDDVVKVIDKDGTYKIYYKIGNNYFNLPVLPIADTSESIANYLSYTPFELYSELGTSHLAKGIINESSTQEDIASILKTCFNSRLAFITTEEVEEGDYNVYLSISTDGRLQEINIGKSSVADVDFLTAANLIKNISDDLVRNNIYDSISAAKRYTLSSSDLATGKFSSNTTIQDMIDKYPYLADAIDTERINDNYILIYGNNIKINGTSYTGRILTSDGRELFVIDGYKGAKRFFGYLNFMQKISDEFSGNTHSLNENVRNHLEETVNEIIKSNPKIREKFQGNNNVVEIVRLYLNGEGNFTGSQAKELSNVIHLITGQYDYLAKKTPLEIDLKAKNKLSGNNAAYNYKITKVDLYNTLVKNNVETGMTLNEFMQLDYDGMSKLLSTAFKGNSLLERMSLSDVHKSKSFTHTENISNTKARKIIGKDKLSEHKIEPTKEFLNWFNAMNFETIGNDGVSHRINAKQVMEDGKPAVEFYSEYDTYYNQEDSIELTLRNTTLQDIFSDITYKTTNMFSLLTEDEHPLITNGMYHGMYVYKGIYNNNDCYIVSKDLISPYINSSNYTILQTLSDALSEIDHINETSKISESRTALMNDQKFAYNKTEIYGKKINPYQIISVPFVGEDIQLGRFSFLEDMSVLKLKEIIKEVAKSHERQKEILYYVNQIHTPDEAAIFLSRLDENTPGLKVQKSFEKDISRALKDYPDQVINSLSDAIKTYENKHYFVLQSSSYQGKNTLIIKELSEQNLNNSVEESSESKVDVLDMNSSINEINSTFGIDIETVTNDDIASNTEFGIDDPDGVKAFIHEGKIYINESNSNINDLYHELAHIILGIIKTSDSQSYNNMIEKTSLIRGFSRRLQSKRALYRLADTDLREEVLCDLIANDLALAGQIRILEGNGYEQLANDILKIIQNKTNVKPNFDSVISVSELLSRNGERMKKRRMVTNMIGEKLVDSDQMVEGRILEKC